MSLEIVSVPDSLLLFAILLAAIIIGYGLGVRSSKSRRNPEPDFIPSVEELLADPDDKSLKQLLDVDRFDQDDVDLLLGLGKNLRERGETRQAIDLHQSLFSRTHLSKITLHRIQLELARDFASAGLLDRAESLFLELISPKSSMKRLRSDSGRKLYEAASHHLIELYEDEKDWPQIISLYEAKRLTCDVHLIHRIAHAYCEIAEEEVTKNNFLAAIKYCRSAMKVDGECSRSYIIQGQLAYEGAEYNEAIRCYLKAIEQDHSSIIHILDPLVASFGALDHDDNLITHLDYHWSDDKYVPVLNAITQAVSKRDGPNKALDSLIQRLKQAPSNRGFHVLVEFTMQHQLTLDQSRLVNISNILNEIVTVNPRFNCVNCGLKTETAYWRCPGCKQWATIKPING